MSSERVHLPRRIAMQLMTLAQRDPDNETGGLIAQGNGDIIRILPLVIEHHGKERRFVEQDFLQAWQSMQQDGESLFAVFHSWPHGATPDRDAIRLPAQIVDAMRITIALDTKGVLKIDGWKKQAGNYSRIETNILRD